MNVCEHGDHPAPDGERFCSAACKQCEGESRCGCDGICLSDEELRKEISTAKAAGELRRQLRLIVTLQRRREP